MKPIDPTGPRAQGEVQSRAGLDSLIRLTELAFREDRMHSLLANVRTLRDEEWTALLPGEDSRAASARTVPDGRQQAGGRTIADILEHVAWAKWMYEDYAFGSGSLRGNEPPMVPEHGIRWRPREEILARLMQGHEKWVTALRSLESDSELEKPRLAHWGAQLPTRDIIHIVIAHDYYHAGEINHLRAVLQGTDGWPY